MRREEQTVLHIEAALTGRLERLAELVLDVTIETGGPIGPILARLVDRHASLRLARKLALRCEEPLYKGVVALRGVALAAVSKVVEAERERSPQAPADLAAWLTLQAGRFVETGEYRKGVAAGGEARDLYAQLLAFDPSTFGPRLAVVLDCLGGALEHVGDLEEARRASQQAVDLLVQHPEAQREDFRLLRAGFLINLAARHRALGNRREAVAAAREGTEIYRGEADRGSSAAKARLASGLSNLAVYRYELGEIEEAAKASRKAEDSLGRLAWEEPASYKPLHSASQIDLAILETKRGRHEAALEHAEKAVEAARSHQVGDKASRLELATALTNLVEVLPSPEGDARAVAFAKEAVEIWKELATEDPDLYEPRYALALNNLAGRQAACGRQGDGLASAREATEILSKHVTRQPTIVRPWLALAFHNLARRLAEAGEIREACLRQQEAVEIYCPLARTQPGSFRAELARALLSLAARRDAVAALNRAAGQSVIGELERGARAARHSVALYWELSRSHQEIHQRSLTAALTVLEVLLERLANAPGGTQEALTSARRSIALYRRLAAGPSHPLMGDLAKGFHEIARPLRQLGEEDLTIEASESALAIHRQLLERHGRTEGEAVAEAAASAAPEP